MTNQPGKKNNNNKERQYLRISDVIDELSKIMRATRAKAEKTNTKSIASYVNNIGIHILLF
jgi:hypothetical protein